MYKNCTITIIARPGTFLPQGFSNSQKITERSDHFFQNQPWTGPKRKLGADVSLSSNEVKMWDSGQQRIVFDPEFQFWWCNYVSESEQQGLISRSIPELPIQVRDKWFPCVFSFIRTDCKQQTYFFFLYQKNSQNGGTVRADSNRIVNATSAFASSVRLKLIKQ